MEMSNTDYNTHVAQQSRRDKLRGSLSSTSLAQNSEEFHTNFLSPLPSSDMFNFTPNSGSYSSIHPTRFVLPVSCDDESRNGHHFKPPFFVESWVEGGGYGGCDNYQNTLQNWGNLHLHPSSFVTDTNTNPNHGLSLSLSSNQISEIRRLGLKPPLEPGINISSIVNRSVSSIRNLGPLGPFTGYTTILKGSKFLKPAQQILDEFLSAAGLKTTTMRENNSSDSSADLSGYGGDHDGSYRPDCHEKKAKLINMQEEVCKRQKQYHQEIQMVMSAFESVPGIASATPYISRSLKTLSRHFKCLKNAIADQLRYIKNILGEDLSSPAASFSRGDYTSLRFGQNFAKVKSSGFGGYQNHIWRPQRGLPERAVSILRAWLFDHFLHPYPTDTDKQMLATQTGLSRNQVSNWFINARVRLWKPMVEEIHMLESKGVSKSNTEPNSNNSGFSSIPILKNNRDNQDYGNQPDFQPKQLDCSGEPSSSSMQMQGSSSTMELKETSHRQITTTGMDLDGSFVGFLPNYERRGLERGGIGIGAAVSLTLGLRQGSETTHQFQQQGMDFGSHIYDAENGV